MEREPFFKQERLVDRTRDNQFEEGRDWWYTEIATFIAENFDPGACNSELETMIVAMCIWDQREHLPEDLVEESKLKLLHSGILGEKG